MALPATDDFNRANEAQLGGNWSLPGGAVGGAADYYGIASNRLVGAGGGGDFVQYWNADSPGGDQYCQVQYISGTGSSTRLGVCARLDTTTGAHYGFRCLEGGTGSRQLFYHDGTNIPGSGASVLLASDTVVLAPNDVIRIETQGTTIRGLINGVVVLSVTDATRSSGRGGLCGRNSFATLLQDNFEIGNIGGGGSTPIPIIQNHRLRH